MSRDRILSAGGAQGASSVAVGFSRRTISLLLAALVGLATFVFLLVGGGGVGTAYAATIDVKVSSLTDHKCDSTVWHFVINQINDEANAPESIEVTWANGDSEDVPLDKFTGGVAHYATTSNLNSTVVSATADIYDGWSGQFNLSHGPCGPTETPSGTPSGTPSEKPSETPSEKPSESPSEKPSETPSEKPSESAKPSESESPAAVPTEVPAGADAAGGGGSAAGLMGLAVVIGGAVAGTAVFARRRFLHDS